MRKAGVGHCMIIAVLMFATGILLNFMGSVRIVDKAGVARNLPERVGAFEGEEILFCQNEQCMKTYVGTDLSVTDKCSLCESVLDDVSLGENQVLPADTILLKKQYSRRGQSPFRVSVVLSGKEQRSIHRPEYCLPAQGYVIQRSSVMPVKIGNEGSVRVKVLELSRKTGGKGITRKEYVTYLYWFVGVKRRTPYHLERLFWMSVDRILYGKNYRWAYISISRASTTADSEKNLGELKSFLKEIYPLIGVHR